MDIVDIDPELTELFITRIRFLRHVPTETQKLLFIALLLHCCSYIADLGYNLACKPCMLCSSLGCDIGACGFV